VKIDVEVEVNVADSRAASSTERSDKLVLALDFTYTFLLNILAEEPTPNTK